jgi:hypothetical protein
MQYLSFYGQKRVKRGYFSKVSTGEIPVFTGPVDFLNRSGPVPVRSGRTGTGLPDRFQLWFSVK